MENLRSKTSIKNYYAILTLSFNKKKIEKSVTEYAVSECRNITWNFVTIPRISRNYAIKEISRKEFLNIILPIYSISRIYFI